MQKVKTSTQPGDNWIAGPLIVFDQGLRVITASQVRPILPRGLHITEVPDALDNPPWLPALPALMRGMELALASGQTQLVKPESPATAALTIFTMHHGSEHSVACQAPPQRGLPGSNGGSVGGAELPRRRWFSRIRSTAAHQLLLATASRLEMAIDAAHIGTFYVPLPMNRIHWNAQCAAHFWIEPGVDVDFDVFYSRLHPADRDRTRQAVEEAVHVGGGYDIEYRVVSPHGQTRWIRAKGDVRYDRNGVPSRFDGITIDISRQKQAEEDRDRLLQNERLQRIEAEQESRLKDTFIATASHELRTPLNVIHSWIELLGRRTSDEAFVQQCVEVVKRSVRSQARLVDDLLDAGRIAAGKLEIGQGQVDLRDVVHAELQALQQMAEQKGIQACDLTSSDQAPPEGGYLVLGDETRLRQVFSNILSNAFKYTPAGGIITVTLARRAADIVVEVKDTGEGIPSQFLETIFATFAQVDGSTTRAHGGLGLGLAIAKRLVALHGGQITAYSEGPGTGATFTTTLPAFLDLGVTRSPDVTVDDLEASTVADFRDLAVLVVEDDPDALQAFRLMLSSYGVNVATASSAEAGRALLYSRDFDGIFSDVSMPHEDGYHFIRTVRAAGIATAAYAVTALARDQDRREALAAGFNGHICKPVQRRSVLQALSRFAAKAAD